MSCFVRSMVQKWTPPPSNVCLAISTHMYSSFVFSGWFLDVFWLLATDLTLTQPWIELNETLEYMLLFSPFSANVKFGVPSASRSFLCFLLLHCSLSLSFLPFYCFLLILLVVTVLPRSVCHFLYLSHLSSTFLNLLFQRCLSVSGCSPWTLSPTECSMPVKVDANNTEVSLRALQHCCTCKYYRVTVALLVNTVTLPPPNRQVNILFKPH